MTAQTLPLSREAKEDGVSPVSLREIAEANLRLTQLRHAMLGEYFDPRQPDQQACMNLDDNLAAVEKIAIEVALKLYQGNLLETARRLGYSRDKLRYRIKKYRLDGLRRHTSKTSD